MKKLASYLKRYTKESILAPLFKLLEVVFDLMVPLVVARMINIGVAGNDYEGAVDSFAVSGLVAQFDRNTAEMNIRGVPATVVNGRYLLKTESVKSAEEYQALVKFLLNKKD